MFYLLTLAVITMWSWIAVEIIKLNKSDISYEEFLERRYPTMSLWDISTKEESYKKGEGNGKRK